VTLTDSFPKASEIVEKVKSKLAELLQTDSPLYHVQEKALGRLIEETWVRNHLVFQLPTGAGKTRVVAAYLWGTILSG
jgi:CRISPR/Cas system-associated endonuclease/helicase Cas3